MPKFITEKHNLKEEKESDSFFGAVFSWAQLSIKFMRAHGMGWNLSAVIIFLHDDLQLLFYYLIQIAISTLEADTSYAQLSLYIFFVSSAMQILPLLDFGGFSTLWCMHITDPPMHTAVLLPASVDSCI